MLSDFFQLSPVPTDQMHGYYSIEMVILSYLVATFASYVALDITGRLRDVGNTKQITFMWLLGGSFAMGAGIWSMHFIGMLAFIMPHMQMNYDPFWTSLSMIVAILASGFAFFILKTKQIKLPHLVFGGIFLGFAIVCMHYLGMEAMKINMDIHYIPYIFSLSIIIAILASEAALYLAIKSNQVVASKRFRLKFISAIIMGAAICGMHYTGMSSAVFTHKAHVISKVVVLNPQLLSISIAGVTFIILGIAFFISIYKEAQNQNLLTLARQAGMSEVASSVLHNVGNVLNSVNISATMISEKIGQSKLTELNQLSALLNDHKNDLTHFLSADPMGLEIPSYITMLANEWNNERTSLDQETQLLINNIEHIKDIISMQQNLSRISKFEQIIGIKSAIEEALSITGIDKNYSEIKLETEYENLKPVLLDKVKFLQIIVNLLQNAKDALKESSTKEKIIYIKAYAESSKLFIQIRDNGIGILPNNINRIFSYGFTTKKNGHGFGLHSSALGAKEMGGLIKIESKGLNKGTTLTLELPYSVAN